MNTLRLEIDLDKIQHNAKTIVDICNKKDINVAGVTKGVAGMPEVARAMLKGGVTHLADARIINIKKIKKAKLKAPTMLIRIPRVSRSREVVKYFDVSLMSEWKVIQAIDKEASNKGVKHDIILMVDLGDLREGLMIDQVIPMIKRIISLKGINLRGVGTNLGCYGGILPTKEKMQQLVDLVTKIQERFDITIPLISAGGTNCLPLVIKGEMPKEVNHLRIGEAILLGRESTSNTLIPGTYQDTFTLISEIIEIKEKPSIPIGKVGKDAFGNTPKFKDLGVRKRAIIALGKQDVILSGLKPMDDNIKILGGSSDQIIIDITESTIKYEIGQEIKFKLLYPSLLSAVTSPYVLHYIKEDEQWIKI
jgi:predicted amino acid racemase